MAIGQRGGGDDRRGLRGGGGQLGVGCPYAGRLEGFAFRSGAADIADADELGADDDVPCVIRLGDAGDVEMPIADAAAPEGVLGDSVVARVGQAGEERGLRDRLILATVTLRTLTVGVTRPW